MWNVTQYNYFYIRYKWLTETKTYIIRQLIRSLCFSDEEDFSISSLSLADDKIIVENGSATNGTHGIENGIGK